MESILADLQLNSERLYSDKKFKEVEGMFTTFLKEAENEPEKLRGQALNDRGHAKYMQVDFTSALKDYDQAIQLCPSLAIAYYNRATIKYRMGHFKDAITDFKVAVDKCPDNEEYRKGLEECEKEEKSPALSSRLFMI
ncbi:unnamed protein product [Lepeophtheirus salmonis]|uniref:(salmon louse) hypothetical protein n=1 Tax=Lepeophtheirus salmonis TaxID=72036 RepID=A0A0K2UM94_LEPSM|nr:tetratricopeptide repeat protein 32-like [Lepeophtheirus salmonis]XP_040570934.1 tetratricopeptide repeat protein 32-like [Lepeophtheirus salmonis]CAB4066479.1 unnamed protein product [Lepeophtheirus salmonis]CAF2972877.1 unnamed protein product [Lepeophtheirus salmonis]